MRIVDALACATKAKTVMGAGKRPIDNLPIPKPRKAMRAPPAYGPRDAICVPKQRDRLFEKHFGLWGVAQFISPARDIPAITQICRRGGRELGYGAVHAYCPVLKIQRGVDLDAVLFAVAFIVVDEPPDIERFDMVAVLVVKLVGALHME